MKIILTVGLAVVLGVAAGIATAVVRMNATPSGGDPAGIEWPMPPQLADGEQLPAVAVDQEEYDFGMMDVDAEGSHDFLIANTGKGILKLVAGETSCRCALSKLDKEEVQPGDSATVTMTWTADDSIGPYRQTAVIFTNDPSQPRVTLTISGRITTAARAVPDELIFSTLSAGQSANAEVSIYCYIDEPLEIVGFKLDNPTTAEYFDVAFEPLNADRLSEEPGAVSGQLMKVTLKSGLLQGPFRQKILLSTNLETSQTLTVSIDGTIGSDIAVVGRGFNVRTGILILGTISGKAGARRMLMLIVRGPNHKEVKFTPVKITPDLLNVEIGEPTEINNGTVSQFPLTVQIPKGCRQANHLGSKQGKLGEILLDTNHPQAPRLRILVSFAVEG